MAFTSCHGPGSNLQPSDESADTLPILSFEFGLELETAVVAMNMPGKKLVEHTN